MGVWKMGAGKMGVWKMGAGKMGVWKMGAWRPDPPCPGCLWFPRRGRRLAPMAWARSRRSLARERTRRPLRRRSNPHPLARPHSQRLQRTHSRQGARLRHRSTDGTDPGRARSLLRLEDGRSAVDALVRLRLPRRQLCGRSAGVGPRPRRSGVAAGLQSSRLTVSIPSSPPR